jgi:hypothetical protein
VQQQQQQQLDLGCARDVVDVSELLWLLLQSVTIYRLLVETLDLTAVDCQC